MSRYDHVGERWLALSFLASNDGDFKREDDDESGHHKAEK